MSHDVTEFQVAGNQQDTLAACRSVAASERWKVTSETPDGIVLRQGLKLAGWPATLDVKLKPAPAGAGTAVHVDGRIFGIGPIQKGYLSRAMAKLRSGLGGA